MRRLALLCLLALALLPAASASAGARDQLWATVNACDSPDSPNAMGVRANIPGNGRRQRIYVRFVAQYYSGADKRWLTVKGARSKLIRAGSARYRYLQEGWSFQFEAPSAGVFLVRGVARIEWRKRKKRRWVPVKRVTRVTSKRKPEDADTGEGLAAASCTIR